MEGWAESCEGWLGRGCSRRLAVGTLKAPARMDCCLGEALTSVALPAPDLQLLGHA